MEGEEVVDSADQTIKDGVEESCVIEDDIEERSTLDEDVESVKSRWKRIYILYYAIFLVCLGHSVTFPSLWPYLTSIDPQITILFLGTIYSVRSVAELVSSLVLGRWCNNQLSIAISTAIFVIANLMYAFAESAGERGIWIIFSSRILLGFSAGGIFFAGRIEASEWAKPDEMAKVMNILAVWEWLGLLAGPILQSVISIMGPNAIHVSRANFYLDMYTTPTYIVILLGITSLILQLTVLRRTELKPEQKDIKSEKEEEKVDENSPGVKVDISGALLLLLIHFSLLSSYVIIETTFTPILMAIFGWGRELTIRYGGCLTSAHFLLGIFSFSVVPPLTKKFSARNVMLVLLIICLINFFIFIPWGPGRLNDKPADDYAAMTIKQDGGCPDAYIWCNNTPNLPLIQYIVALFIDGIITPMAFAMVIILYTKILGQFRVGHYMGWYHGTESFAKIISPLFSVLLFFKFGLRGTFGYLVVIVALDIILLIIMWKRIVPYDEQPAQYEALNAQNDAS